NFIGKAANGIADDFLTTTVMACAKPIVIAPAMNTQMLLSDATQDNIKKLKNRGVHFIESAEGLLACGDSGKGRLAKLSDIVDYLAKVIFLKNDFNGKTVLVTAGATRENIDPVRYITNHSSGKMGLAIAIAAKNRGAKVILVHGSKPSKITTNFEKVISVTSTDQMFKAVMDNLEAADIIIKAAAPSDYKITQNFTQKIKAQGFSLNFYKNVDIAAEVGKKKGNKKLVIFAAETENLIKNATKKLNNKKADLIVANDITQDGAGFNSDTNIVTLISKTKTTPYPKMSKLQVAETIIDEVLKL
ncbi:MAG: bifunctional phosphopantothenoylcysteine decarboxylase/phosphopantothenate--cysteine ligase CoaBC, partial [Firmicutes bacterium]|nr:bifunctional phosphopantothenoylcysteine decarboxylase/phosphopantothenate--cysteine ligase CoaBC [Bacillota bacterium]